MTNVLFVCLANAGRSQMSQALFCRAAGDRHEGRSAGSEAEPDGSVHPEVIEVMAVLALTCLTGVRTDWTTPTPSG